MDKDLFNSDLRGQVRRTLEGYDAFIPSELPRQMSYSPLVVEKLDAATAALHRLAGVGRLLPHAAILMGPHVRLEAVLSSRIEGTQSNVDQLLRFESGQSVRDGELHEDVVEVRNYLIALDHGLRRVKDLPVGVRLLNEIHATLLKGVRGDYATPGEFRKSQNWIGGANPATAVFVPPPVDEMRRAIADWERFINEQPFPLLIQLAIAHYQFEAIHPYLDGNGRVGRLLIPLILCERKVLNQPLLYLSAYLERHRSTYYDLLLATSQHGDFDAWLLFFLEGVRVQATDAEERTIALMDLQIQLRNDLHERRATLTTLRLADLLFSSPYLTAAQVQTRLDVKAPTAQSAIDSLIASGHLREVTGKKRDRVYFAQSVFDAVYQETADGALGPNPTEGK